MFSPNSVKFFLCLLLVSAIFSACGYWQKTENKTPDANVFTAVEMKSEVPFSTKEPKTFQAEIVVTAGGIENKTFAARNGANRRYDYNFGEKNAVSDVRSETSGNFLILDSEKIYAENNSADNSAQSADDVTNSLTTEWLNQKADAKFTNLGAENNLTKYLVVLGDGGNSESLIYVDEKIGLPVKQEFYSLSDGRRTLRYTMELRNFKPQADLNSFEIPKDYSKVSVEKLRKILRKGGK